VSAAPPANRHSDDVRVARVHLRLGQLTLARAEFEDLLRRDALDGQAMAALAEARWRTGDAVGAADAAFTHIEAGGADDVALCIAAEAAASDGRATEARALMDRLPAADAATLDALFAGMPRRAFWPAGPVDRSDLDELRRGADRRGLDRRGAGRDQLGPSGLMPTPTDSAGAADGRAARAAPPEVRSVPGPRSVIEATSGSDWDAAGLRPEAESGLTQVERTSKDPPIHQGRRLKGQLDPGVEIVRARAELENRPERAFLRLALVLRHDPTYAPAVLELLRLRREPTAALVRGDAQRLLGRHLEAEAAFDSAAESLEVS
jgi:hypothetical protein